MIIYKKKWNFYKNAHIWRLKFKLRIQAFLPGIFTLNERVFSTRAQFFVLSPSAARKHV